MWKLYDALIEAIPDDRRVEFACLGPSRAFVLSESGGLASIAMRGTGGRLSGSYAGRPLREVAALARSWNMEEASLGMAAINAFHNDPRLVSGRESSFSDAFTAYAEEVKGKKVGMIGHFSAAEWMREVCRLSVFERIPQDALDLPDTAEEFLLPEQEIVFITGMTLGNKSLPRLLTLCRDARVILVGPSVPLTPLLKEFGVSALFGFYVTDPNGCREAVQGHDCRKFFAYGKKVGIYL